MPGCAADVQFLITALQQRLLDFEERVEEEYGMGGVFGVIHPMPLSIRIDGGGEDNVEGLQRMKQPAVLDIILSQHSNSTAA